MKKVSQDILFKSKTEALNSTSIKIDGRDEQDLMCFLINFASIINLYDHSNKISGNWEHILLKDPVFLLAYISRTKHLQWHQMYLKRCQLLKNLINDNPPNNINSIPEALGQLLHQVINGFIRIEKWTYYMDKSIQKYSLEDFVKRDIEEELSVLFWALVEMRNYLIQKAQISSFKELEFKQFSQFSSKSWQAGKNEAPFWTILDATTPVDKNLKPVYSNQNILNSITKVGDVLFTFLKQVVDYANNEFEVFKTQKSNFPDTTLIRAFLEVFQIHQSQLNTLSKKHLNFYYDDILKQDSKPAIPDKAFISLELSKQTKDYLLKKGTEFSAGVDSNSNPILFKTLNSTKLSATKIVDVFTLSKNDCTLLESNCFFKNENLPKTTFLELNKIQSPSVVKRDKHNNIQSWNIFGNANGTSVKSVSMGFAIASPMLLLKEGTRMITLTFTFNEDIAFDVFADADFFLSTQSEWFKVERSKKRLSKVRSKNQAVLQFILDIEAPAIESFKKNPDGLDSDWPMFKVVFNQFQGGLEEPPIIKELTIDVEVSSVKTFQISNSKGPLSGKKPFQLFGMTPAGNSEFYIGNSEILSKPLNDLSFQIIWDHLPESRDFKTYYSQYNDYLNGQYDSIPITQAPKNLKKPKTAFQRFCDWLNDGNSNNGGDSGEKAMFKNESFLVNFMQLNDGEWHDFDMFLNQEDILIEAESKEPSSQINTPLFSIVGSTTSSCDGKAELPENINKLSFCSSYSYSKPVTKNTKSIQYVNDPYIQNETLKYSTTSKSGFIKMILNNPSLGFGSEIYPKVVSAIALFNAALIAKVRSKTINLKKPANVPFVPTVKSFIGNYSASQTYKLDGNDASYPIQWYTYSPFLNYKVYDNTSEKPFFEDNINQSLDQQDATKSNIPLWSTYKSSGTLFLGLQNKSKPDVINLFFELIQDYNNTALNTGTVVFSYMSTSGWKTVDIKYDGTNNFNCSGIVTIELPEDISDMSATMPNGIYWLSISTDNSNRSIVKAALLALNGVEVERASISYLKNGVIPQVNSNSIKKPLKTISEITKVQQDFPSFGGVAAETTEDANSRISTRLKTKDRIITTGDIYDTIKIAFPSVFYNKSIYKNYNTVIDVYVIKSLSDATDLNAFSPTISTCDQSKIQEFLQNRAPGSLVFKVTNFNMVPVTITANITLRSGSNILESEQRINKGIKIFLSPWVKSEQKQTAVDKPIQKALLEKFIKSFPEVLRVDSLKMSLSSHVDSKAFTKTTSIDQVIYPPDKSSLLISAETHNITCKTVE